MLFQGLFLAAILTTTPIQEVGSLPKKLSISFEDAQKLGNRIWKNECAGKIEGLTSWNDGEEFASVGIGHFIWYPSLNKKAFNDTFPDLLIFMESCGITIPKWIGKDKGCPWRNRQHFNRHQNMPRMVELREFLYETRTLQAIYMANRLEQALPRMTSHLELKEKRKVEKHFYSLVSTSKGLYALIDYLNFKGEGISVDERYSNKGWGLLQVLQRIPEQSIRPIDDFVKAAKEVLAERVLNSPRQRHEQRWLKGWNARIDTYQSG